MTELTNLTKKDFMSDQEVKWCPGCGDYAVLSSVQMSMAQMGLVRENVAIISGIGCSSRFPYYMNTYGMHSIHGRAPAVASGLKLQNPNLSVWVITGDGDGLSIGGNHLAHILRRNIDVNIILFNNEIYGLTKGQYSPTSKIGTTTKSTPYGSIDRPFVPAKFAMGSGVTFYARTIDTDPKHMMEVFKEAQSHKGTSLVEVYQNCVIFNDKVHDAYTNRLTRDDNSIRLEAGKPLIFGKDRDKAIVFKNLKLEVVNKDSVPESEILVHDPSNETLSYLLAGLDMPVAIGVLKQVDAPIYENQLYKQLQTVEEKKGKGKVSDLLMSGDTWEVF